MYYLKDFLINSSLFGNDGHNDERKEQECITRNSSDHRSNDAMQTYQLNGNKQNIPFNFSPYMHDPTSIILNRDWKRFYLFYGANQKLLTNFIFDLTLKQSPPKSIVMFMLQLNPNGVDVPKFGMSALQIAVEQACSAEVIKTLIEANPFALVESKGNNHLDPLSFAKRFRSKEKDVIELLSRPLSYWLVSNSNEKEGNENEDAYLYDCKERINPSKIDTTHPVQGTKTSSENKLFQKTYCAILRNCNQNRKECNYLPSNQLYIRDGSQMERSKPNKSLKLPIQHCQEEHVEYFRISRKHTELTSATTHLSTKCRSGDFKDWSPSSTTHEMNLMYELNKVFQQKINKMSKRIEKIENNIRHPFVNMSSSQNLPLGTKQHLEEILVTDKNVVYHDTPVVFASPCNEYHEDDEVRSLLTDNDATVVRKKHRRPGQRMCLFLFHFDS